jgi:hypothetical protein
MRLCLHGSRYLIGARCEIELLLLARLDRSRRCTNPSAFGGLDDGCQTWARGPFVTPGFSNPGSWVKLSMTILAGPTVLSAFGLCPPHVAPGDFGGSMCEAHFAIADIAEPGTISPSPRPGRDDSARLSARTRGLDQAGCIVASSDDQLNSVPSIHIRCRMTASFRATATRALLRLLRLAMRMPQALRADHLATRVNSTLAAS